LRSPTERGLLVLAALYLAAALHGLGAADIVGDDEAREAGIVQDVVAGHWLWPRFNAELLPDKPLLYHWLAAIPCGIAGFSESAVRLPSAVAGAALVLWTGGFGGLLLGRRAGFAAALLLATMPGLFDHARVARPDVLLVLLLSAALGRAFRWWRDGRRRDATLALVLLGAATLAKGPVGPALFVVALGGFLAWQGDLRRLPRLVTPAGLVALVGLGLGWYAIALAGWGERFVHEHLVGRYVRNLAGGLASGAAYSPKPLLWHLFFYPMHLPAIVLPWTPAILFALWQAARGSGLRDPRLRFLLCWAAAPIVVFTPAEWKLRYYLLPALPPLALVAAPAVIELLGAPPRWPGTRRLIVVLAGVLGIALVGLAARDVRLSPSDRDTFEALVRMTPGGHTGLAVGVGLLAGALAGAIAWRAWAALVAITVLGATAWIAFGTPTLEQAVSRRDSLKGFAQAVAERYPPPAPLAFYGGTIRQVAVYLGRPTPNVRDPTPGSAVIASETASRLLLRTRTLPAPVLSGDGRVGNLAHMRIFLFDIPANRALSPPPASGMGPESRADYPREYDDGVPGRIDRAAARGVGARRGGRAAAELPDHDHDALGDEHDHHRAPAHHHDDHVAAPDDDNDDRNAHDPACPARLPPGRSGKL
jgi:4-amino-4-deoxy-L-arabinose transferase-like glycosyltransferase